MTPSTWCSLELLSSVFCTSQREVPITYKSCHTTKIEFKMLGKPGLDTPQHIWGVDSDASGHHWHALPVSCHNANTWPGSNQYILPTVKNVVEVATMATIATTSDCQIKLSVVICPSQARFSSCINLLKSVRSCNRNRTTVLEQQQQAYSVAY